MNALKKALHIPALFFYWLTMPYWNWRENRIADRNAEAWRTEFPPAWSMSFDEYRQWRNSLTADDIAKMNEEFMNAGCSSDTHDKCQ